MQERQVDIAIIGAGTAGLGAYRAAKQHGGKVVMIEPGPYGTTCARAGCMPSKLRPQPYLYRRGCQSAVAAAA